MPQSKERVQQHLSLFTLFFGEPVFVIWAMSKSNHPSSSRAPTSGFNRSQRPGNSSRSGTGGRNPGGGSSQAIGGAPPARPPVMSIPYLLNAPASSLPEKLPALPRPVSQGPPPPPPASHPPSTELTSVKRSSLAPKEPDSSGPPRSRPSGAARGSASRSRSASRDSATGSRPHSEIFACDVCGATFLERGNVRNPQKYYLLDSFFYYDAKMIVLLCCIRTTTDNSFFSLLLFSCSAHQAQKVRSHISASCSCLPRAWMPIALQLSRRPNKAHGYVFICSSLNRPFQLFIDKTNMRSFRPCLLHRPSSSKYSSSCLPISCLR